MRLNYFCPHHVAVIRQCEGTAVQWWNELMKRGLLAYNDCRLEAADIFLKSALSLSLLRYAEPHNAWLTSIHITKPAEFLIELALNEQQFDAAIQLLSTISNETWPYVSDFEDSITEFLAKQYERIESQEKEYMSKNFTQKPHHMFTKAKAPTQARHALH